jgi:hypothetical protein
MKSRESKLIPYLAFNDPSLKDKEDSDQIGFMSKIRYQCASSIITIPVSIVRELNLKLGETVIVNVKKNRQ